MEVFVEKILLFLRAQFLPNEAISPYLLGRDIHINIDYYRWRNITFLAGGLQSLQLVESFVKASLYGSFVARELREGVWPIGISDIGKTQGW
jgi:hypothetical protein